MNILFVGRFYSPEQLSTIREASFGKIGFSNHNFEMSLLKGLSQQDAVTVKAVSCPSTAAYPQHYRYFSTPSQSYKVFGIPVESCGFCNFFLVKRQSRIIAWRRIIKKTIDSFPAGDVHIIANTSGYEILKAVHSGASFQSRRITITVIIPDVPSVLTLMQHYSFFKQILLRRLDKKSTKLTEKSNHLVLLTKQMKDLYRTPSSYIVMEGLIDPDNKKMTIDLDTKKEVILYTGTLRKQFGVLNLLAAFKMVEQKTDAELWICGSGESDEIIRKEAEKDPRIKFYGLVSSEEAAALQTKATILVNPRTSEGEYTKYSFPSKTLEYLLAKRSVVINRLPGIPQEYFKFVYAPKNESVEELAATILEVINAPKDVRESMAKEGYDFVVNKKNAAFQVGRIIKMIESE